jgi:hypothetical protein
LPSSFLFYCSLSLIFSFVLLSSFYLSILYPLILLFFILFCPFFPCFIHPLPAPTFFL